MRLTLVKLSVLRTLLMMRTVYIVLFLAALMAASASGSPAPSASAHTRAAAPKASHRKAHHVSARTARRTAKRKTRHARSHAKRHSARKPQARAVRGARPKPPSRPAAAHPARTPETSAPETSAPDTEQPPVKPAAEAVSLHTIRIVATPPLRGSAESLARQNEKTEADGLERILDENDLDDRIARGMLVPVPTSAALTINGDLPPDRRYCRPWTATFLSDLARAHAARFHDALEVSSAVRTVAYQKRLMETNGNAAQAEGDIVSPHVTGATIDIAKSGLSRREIYWMRIRLRALQNAGKIDVEEEFQQACFHITVYKSYAPARPASTPHRHAAAPPAADEDSSSGSAELAAHGR